MWGLQLQETEFSVPGIQLSLRQVLGLLINNSHCLFRPLILARGSRLPESCVSYGAVIDLSQWYDYTFISGWEYLGSGNKGFTSAFWNRQWHEPTSIKASYISTPLQSASFIPQALAPRPEYVKWKWSLLIRVPFAGNLRYKYSWKTFLSVHLFPWEGTSALRAIPFSIFHCDCNTFGILLPEFVLAYVHGHTHIHTHLHTVCFLCLFCIIAFNQLWTGSVRKRLCQDLTHI